MWPPTGHSKLAALEDSKSIVERAERDEYHRLLYVAMTRARDRLYVCGWQGIQEARGPLLVRPHQGWARSARPSMTATTASRSEEWRAAQDEAALQRLGTKREDRPGGPVAGLGAYRLRRSNARASGLLPRGSLWARRERRLSPINTRSGRALSPTRIATPGDGSSTHCCSISPRLSPAIRSARRGILSPCAAPILP